MASRFISAFGMVLAVTLVSCRGWGPKLGPLAVPVAILLLMWLVGPISSMCINPARAFGPAVVTGCALALRSDWQPQGGTWGLWDMQDRPLCVLC